MQNIQDPFRIAGTKREKRPVDLGVALFLFCLFMTASILTSVLFSHGVAAITQPYVELHGRETRVGPSWTTRYTLERSPVRYHVALIPSIFIPPWLGSVAILVLIAGIVDTLSQGRGHAAGILRGMNWVCAGTLVLSSAALLVYLFCPLRHYSGAACRTPHLGFPICNIPERLIIDPD
jgi:putative copper export protein